MNNNNQSESALKSEIALKTAVPSQKKGCFKYGLNPFLDELTVPVKTKFTNRQGGTFTSDPNKITGEIDRVEVAQITQVQQVDADKFVKIYTDEISRFFSLKKSTQKILEIVLVELQKHKEQDQIYIDYDSAIDYFTQSNSKIMTRATFHSCLKEMIKAEFIAESKHKNQYYINPALFFNGNRLRMVKEYVVKKNDVLGKS